MRCSTTSRFLSTGMSLSKYAALFAASSTLVIADVSLSAALEALLSEIAAFLAEVVAYMSSTGVRLFEALLA